MILSSICPKNIRFMLTLCRVYVECVWIDWNSHLNNFYCMFDSHEIISYLGSSLQYKSPTRVSCRLPRKWEKLGSSTILERKMGQNIFLPSNGHRNDWGSYLKRKQNVQWDWINEWWLMRSLWVHVITEKYLCDGLGLVTLSIFQSQCQINSTYYLSSTSLKTSSNGDTTTPSAT